MYIGRHENTGKFCPLCHERAGQETLAVSVMENPETGHKNYICAYHTLHHMGQHCEYPEEVVDGLLEQYFWQGLRIKFPEFYDQIHEETDE